MILSKEIAVCLNLAACKLKQYTASMLKKYGVDLTPEQFLLIDLLWNQGTMTQQNVADTMHKDKNSVTKLVDALEQKDLVVRQKGESDRRENILVLTPKAIEMKESAKETGISILEDMIHDISEDELKSFLSTLGKLTSNMDR